MRLGQQAPAGDDERAAVQPLHKHLIGNAIFLGFIGDLIIRGQGGGFVALHFHHLRRRPVRVLKVKKDVDGPFAPPDGYRLAIEDRRQRGQALLAIQQ